MAIIGRRTLIAGAGAACLAARTPQVKAGDAAPPFTLLTFQFKKIASTELTGQVIMLNYWATWCAPCRHELPALDAYYRRHARDGLKIFAVKSEADQRPNQDLLGLAKVVSFPLIWSLKGKGYGDIGGALPSNYVIDRSGVVRYAQAGAFDAESLEAIVTPLLKEAAPAAPAAASAT